MSLARSFPDRPAVVSVLTEQNGSFVLFTTTARLYTFSLQLKNAEDTVVRGRANTISRSKLTKGL